MDSLRDRIAEVLYERTMSRLSWYRSWADLHPESKELWLSDADAVIAALELREEKRTNPMSSAGYTVDSSTGERKWHSDIRHDHRYVTEWENDE